MIFFFSGTGNSRWAATKLSAATRERLIFFPDIMGDNTVSQPFTLQEGERLGFVFPVHGWKVPRLVRQCIERLKIFCPSGKRPFTYTVCTAGDDIGLTVENLSQTLSRNGTLRQSGITGVDSAYSLIMPESYVGLPFMDVDKKEREREKIASVRQQLEAIIPDIIERKAGIFQLKEGAMPWTKTKVIGSFFERFLITDKRFHVTKERCVKCGICANVCPVRDIDGGKGKLPRWRHNGNCLTCFSCYHHCPHHAIEFGHQTQRKGQYFFRS